MFGTRQAREGYANIRLMRVVLASGGAGPRKEVPMAGWFRLIRSLDSVLLTINRVLKKRSEAGLSAA
jgi:hypothetical protein